MPTMSRRERVMAALSHRQPDRVPADLGTTVVTGIAIKAYDRLKAYLGMNLGQTRLYDRRNQLALVDDEMLDRLSIDTRGIACGLPENRPIVEVPERNAFIDEWGLMNAMPEGVDNYFIANEPLGGEISLHDILSYPWPDPEDPGRTRGLRERALAARAADDRALVLPIPASIVQQSQLVRGFQDWYQDVALNPDLLAVLLDKFLELQTAIAGKLLDAVGDLIDIVFIYDDLAMQDRLVVSPRHYRKLLEPRLRTYAEFLHSKTQAKLVHHTDGAVVPVLESLADMGVDAVNPVQVSARDMGDTAALKQLVGSRMGFWGGVDTQTTLPRGTVEEVRQETRLRVRDLGTGGGYVLGAVHNIQGDVPPENTVALFDVELRKLPTG